MAPRRFSAPFLSLVTAVIVAGNGALAPAAVLYDENVTGAAATTLNGQIPDVDQNGGFNQWRAHTGFLADGSMTVPANGSGGWLPFIPQAGFTYTLSVSLTGVTGNTNWLGVGFGESVPANPQGTGNDYRFISGPTVGKAWMLFRAQSTSATTKNQTQRGDATTGTLAANQADWLGTEFYGGDVDMQIVLDTTGGANNYTATFYAKRPTDANYTLVSGSNLPLAATDIGAVGFVGSNSSPTNIDATITNFTLETTGPTVVPGDVDGNGVVNTLDFNVIRDHLFNAATSRADGDLNSDGTVNFTDFRLWKSVASAEVLAEIGAWGVPEPASCGLALFAGLGLAAVRRRYAASAT